MYSLDRSIISLDRSLVDKLVNITLLSKEYIFLAFYNTLLRNLYKYLIIKLITTYIVKKGI
jgi:hypothetical protein